MLRGLEAAHAARDTTIGRGPTSRGLFFVSYGDLRP
jgi:hypothetical protein